MNVAHAPTTAPLDGSPNDEIRCACPLAVNRRRNRASATRAGTLGASIEEVAISSEERIGGPRGRVGRDAVALRLPTLAVAVAVVVLELDPRPFGRFRDKTDFNLAGPVGIRLDLPLRTDVPADHESVAMGDWS